MTGARLAGADLRSVCLRNVDLTDADLRSADLRRADLTGADFTGADLRGADLREARLTAVHFRGTRCDESTRWPAGFRAEACPGLSVDPRPAESRREGHTTFWTVAGLVLAADQIVKLLVRDFLPQGGSPRWLPGDVIFLQRVENHGLNLQLLEGQGSLLTLAMVLVLAAVFAAWTILARRGPVAACTLTGLALVFGGGLGNALDRIASGAVLDYIGIYGGPVINLADLAVLAGLLCLGLTRNEAYRRPTVEAPFVSRPANPGMKVHYGR